MAFDQTELYSLLERIALEDKQAFSRFYDVTISRVFAVILKVTSKRELAEEVTSDVYMQVWRTADKFNSELASPMTWVIMIARSRSIDALRREHAATRLQLPLIEAIDLTDKDEITPLVEAIDEEKHRNFQEMVVLLGNAERQMITLAFYRGMSHREIAAYTGKPLGSVKTILRRSLSALRSILNKKCPCSQDMSTPRPLSECF